MIPMRDLCPGTSALTEGFTTRGLRRYSPKLSLTWVIGTLGLRIRI
jgi:hypothetical protein